MPKPKNIKKLDKLKGGAGPNTSGRARKTVAGEDEKEKRKFRHTENFNYRQKTRKAQGKASADKLPFQKKPVLRLLRSFVDECSGDDGMRMTGSARSLILEAARNVVYDAVYGAYNITVIARKKQTLQVRDLMLYLTSHPDYSKIISIDKRLYNQAHVTGATSLTSSRTFTDLGGDGAQKAAGSVMKVRKGKTGTASAKVTKNPGKKTSKKKNKKTEKAPEAEDPETTIDPNAAEMAVDTNEKEASVEEEDGGAMELE